MAGPTSIDQLRTKIRTPMNKNLQTRQVEALEVIAETLIDMRLSLNKLTVSK